ncbi:2-amino-4-hydroxy-6-hydroxymethyldihydropteridine diphosphokinase [Roseburia sp. 499]|uniref:2-amino-4-hydroxy-6- hydroxymethyldihydropteridine diphosphokinase n=1 Tax=Roseburia sp. 499 TaxID=1261634 RepID=UPI001FA82422|nr:2-amino-4-hydroxy-6-hydroxymethyldihydropteridine diphosphokinase [Roseburia sp. 499]WVK68653.1 2-amino-4-hydroxy-6-hydroxymethyldihydropteridine diphosphokinase [Roseburia sp. 499]
MEKEAWDKIHIKNLEVFGKHGVFPEENKLGQKFLVNAVLYTSTREAGRTDDLTKSIHYGEVSHFITKYMMEHTFQLIETVAEQLAKALLLQFEHLKWIDLEIQKPWAPIGLPLESVSVEISRGWHQAFIATGSNLGDRGEYISKGIEALKACEDCVVEKESELIVTAPYGVTDQPDFLNGMLQVRTLFRPLELLNKLNEIEAEAKRERNIHWGPRTLDMDIIFYDDLVLDTPKLTIPHADMQNRKFVLEPLAELAPWYRHPILGKTVKKLLEELVQ